MGKAVRLERVGTARRSHTSVTCEQRPTLDSVKWQTPKEKSFSGPCPCPSEAARTQTPRSPAEPRSLQTCQVSADPAGSRL